MSQKDKLRKLNTGTFYRRINKQFNWVGPFSHTTFVRKEKRNRESFLIGTTKLLNFKKLRS